MESNASCRAARSPRPVTRPSRHLLVAIIALVLVIAPTALAYEYYPAFPTGAIGLSRPVIGQRLILKPDEPAPTARMWLDGQSVPVTWDAASGCLRYAPPTLLAPGTHQVKLVVEMESLWKPVVSTASPSALTPSPSCRRRTPNTSSRGTT